MLPPSNRQHSMCLEELEEAAVHFECSIFALKLPFQEWPIKHAQASYRLEVQELLLPMLPAAADVELVPGAAGRTPPAPAPCLPVPALVDHIHNKRRPRVQPRLAGRRTPALYRSS